MVDQELIYLIREVEAAHREVNEAAYLVRFYKQHYEDSINRLQATQSVEKRVLALLEEHENGEQK